MLNARRLKDRVVLEGYRSRRLGTGEVRRLLGLETRMDAETWLAAKGASMSYSQQDLEQDQETIRALFGKNS